MTTQQREEAKSIQSDLEQFKNQFLGRLAVIELLIKTSERELSAIQSKAKALEVSIPSTQRDSSWGDIRDGVDELSSFRSDLHYVPNTDALNYAISHFGDASV